ncbi:MAG: hypothetical protein AAFP26_05770 [Planctomycetota bacterium]
MQFTLWCWTDDEADKPVVEPINERVVQMPWVTIDERELPLLVSDYAEVVERRGRDGWSVLTLDRSEAAADFVERTFGISRPDFFHGDRSWYLERTS